MPLHRLEQAQDVSHPRQRHAFFARQVLDDLHLADVALRVPPSVRRRPKRVDEPRVLVKHQRSWMRLEDLGRHADRVERLVKGAERRLGARLGTSTTYMGGHGPPTLSVYPAVSR